MDSRVLRIFLTIAELGSVTAASEALHISQPALSRQLITLENELDTKLFHRKYKNMVLTEDGEFLRKRAQEIILSLDAIEPEMLQKRRELSGNIYISGVELSSLQIVADAVQTVRKSIRCCSYSCPTTPRRR